MLKQDVKDVRYDFTADLTGIGDRSVNEITQSFFYLIVINTDIKVLLLINCVQLSSLS